MGARDKIGSVLDLHTCWGIHDGFVLTKKGSLIGAIELSGRDPDGMAPVDHVGLMHIARGSTPSCQKICPSRSTTRTLKARRFT
jgi:hypothetical protein